MTVLSRWVALLRGEGSGIPLVNAERYRRPDVSLEPNDVSRGVTDPKSVATRPAVAVEAIYTPSPTARINPYAQLSTHPPALNSWHDNFRIYRLGSNTARSSTSWKHSKVDHCVRDDKQQNRTTRQKVGQISFVPKDAYDYSASAYMDTTDRLSSMAC